MAKLNPAGSALVYSTYLGGEGYDTAQSIAVDGVGAAYVAGETFSQRFPVMNALQPVKNSSLANCFVAKFDAGGALVYSTYLGGSGGDYANAIAVDAQGNAYIAGPAESLDFPLQNPLQSSFQAHSLLKTSDGAASWTALDTGVARNASVNGVAVDPHDPRNVFIATYRGVFKSTDRGVSWTSASKGLTEPFISAIAIDQVNTATLYATASIQAFKSTDAGGSWQVTTSPRQGFSFSSVAIDPFNSSNILLGDAIGIYKSTDGGVTWRGIYLPVSASGGISPIVPDPKTAGVWYALVPPNIILKSTNGGDYWTRVFANFYGGQIGTHAFDIDPVNTSTLYVGAYNGIVFKSTDGGATFPTSVQPAGTPAGYVTAILVDPVSTSNVYGSLNGTGVYKSSDGGVSWKPASNGLTNPYVNSIAAAIDGAGILYLGTTSISHAFVSKLDSAGASLAYSTYIGGEGNDVPISIAIDSSLNCHIAGYTSSKAFPQSSAFQPTINGGTHSFVCKVDPLGSRLVYSTYFGGNGYDIGRAIAVDGAGNATIGGETTSDNLDLLSPFQPSYAGLGDAFIAQFDPVGTLRYSTYLGGKISESINSVSVDSTGSVYVTGFTGSDDFPLTPGAVHTGSTISGAVFVTKITNNATQLEVTAARIDGKNLLVYGQNFAAGAIILLNGQPEKTRNDTITPAALLIGKKLVKQISAGQMVTLQVRNPDGTMSNQLSFTRPAN